MLRFYFCESAANCSLLPKLISGELCMPDVEKILEDAA